MRLLLLRNLNQRLPPLFSQSPRRNLLLRLLQPDRKLETKSASSSYRKNRFLKSPVSLSPLLGRQTSGKRISQNGGTSAQSAEALPRPLAPASLRPEYPPTKNKLG